MINNILNIINGEIRDFKTKQIQIVPGLSFNQYDTVQKAIYYYNSKFKSGEIDDEGDKKFFYNINKNPCRVFTKGIDFDTKNINILTAGGGDPLKTWFMERDVKYWMRDKQFGKVLNRIFYELPIYGSVVLKIVDGTPYFVDLRNFVVEQGAEDLSSMNFKTEIHNYTVNEFRKIGKKMGWKKADIDEAIRRFHQMEDTSHIKIYERYGEIEEMNENTGEITYPYKRIYIADVGIDQFDQYGNLEVAKNGVLLGSDEWDPEDEPYWEFHIGKVPGRWLGVGIVETLFEPQIRMNEIVNLQSKTSYWAAIRLFFSRDPNMAGNLKTEKRNGQVITGDSEITQVDMSDRNLAFFNEETQKWERNVNDLTVAYAPVGHSVIAIQVAQDQVVSYFEQIQEDIAMDVKEMLYEVILPQFEKDSNAEHTIRLVGKDLDTYIGMVKNELVFKEIIRQVVDGDHFPTNADKDAIGVAVEEAIKQHKEKILTIPKGFYENVKYDIDIDITGESVDKRTRAAAKFALLQALTVDPTMISDPFKKKILVSYMEDAGLNPNDFFDVESKDVQDVAPAGPQTKGAGGGISAPATGIQSPLAGGVAQVAKTV